MEKCPKCGYIEKRKSSKHKDKNFKVIRQGDIIKTPSNNIFLVDSEFKNLEYWIHGRGAYCLCACWLKIIGNIYDNPKMKYSNGHGDPLEKIN